MNPDFYKQMYGSVDNYYRIIGEEGKPMTDAMRLQRSRNINSKRNPKYSIMDFFKGDNQ